MILNDNLHTNICVLIESEVDKILEVLKTNGSMTVYNWDWDYGYNDGRLDFTCECSLPDRDPYHCYVTIDYSDNSVVVELTDDSWEHTKELEGTLEREILKIL